MRAMRQVAVVESRCSGGFRRTVVFFVEAGPVKRTIRLPHLIWFMTLPIWAMNNKTLAKCTLDHAQWQGVAGGENHVAQENLPQSQVCLRQRQEVQKMLLGQGWQIQDQVVMLAGMRGR